MARPVRKVSPRKVSPKADRPPLAGRVALVTGGARRIGREIVLALAAAGADVAIHAHTGEAAARDLARRVVALGGRAVVLRGDLSDAATCEALPGQVVRALGRLDVLVNNAAVFEATDPRTPDAAAWDRMFAVNARAVHLVSTAAARALERSRGTIVNVACASAASPWAGFLAYSASKAAVVSLTRGMAKALAPRVRVNAVAPGPVLRAPGTSAARDRSARAATALGRWGRPEDVAEAVLFLAARAPFVTGVVLPVDGGRHLFGG